MVIYLAGEVDALAHSQPEQRPKSNRTQRRRTTRQLHKRTPLAQLPLTTLWKNDLLHCVAISPVSSFDTQDNKALLTF